MTQNEVEAHNQRVRARRETRRRFRIVWLRVILIISTVVGVVDIGILLWLWLQ